jgi:ATP-dependent Lon protease
MTVQPLQLPSDFNGEVRLFPLPDLVLFPSNVLPLHIFESRYREMMEDAERGDGLITMATLVPGFESEYYSRPKIAPVVCIGRVLTHEKSERGTYNLVLAGMQRARIKHEIEPVRSFRRATVDLLTERLGVDNDDRRELGNKLLRSLLTFAPSAREFVDELKRMKTPLSSLTDIVAFHAPLDSELKLELLAESDAVVRAQVLLENLPPESTNSPRPRSYPPDFSVN